jgi:pilus assembly protein CpaB
MKLVTVGLFAVGVVAAASAAVLVASLQGGPAKAGESAPTETTIVVASRELAAMTTLDESAVTTRTVKAGLAPAGAFGDAVQCIGKMLTAPVHAGQALTSDAFAADGAVSRLAAALPSGRRAVSISLGDNSAVSLLYPGCLVDVLATMRITRKSGEQQAVTVTLMQSVTVLAVGAQTIVSPAGTAATDAHTGERPSVALLVDSRQAEMLKLAMQEGSLSLILRNPADTDHATAMGADMNALVPAPASVPAPMPAPVDALPPALPPALPITAAPAAIHTIDEPQQQTWEATVLRGSERESRTFVLPASHKP